MSSYQMERIDDVCQIKVLGGLTAVLVPELQPMLRQEIASGSRRVTFDLAQTTMVDSSGIGLLIASGNSLAEKNGKLAVINTAPEIFKLLGSMRLISRLNVTSGSGVESHE